MGYNLYNYGCMINDGVRMEAFIEALRRAVRPESVVLDIGTGTGIFALLACQLEARRVYAIEPNDAIQVAREISAANGYADRIVFIQDLSTQVTLPELADVIISDLGGAISLYQHHIPSISDARNRFLAPGGVLIPQRDTLWASVVESGELYSRHTTPWDDNPYHLEMQAAKRMMTNTWRKGYVSAEEQLVEPQCWATLDYARIESPDVGSQLTWTAVRSGTGHGFAVWFDRTLCEGINLSNAPGAPETARTGNVYEHIFFPWSAPVPLSIGDQVIISLETKLIGDNYVWRWDTVVLGQGNPAHVKANFRQSDLLGVPLSPSQLRKQAAGYVPTLSQEGEAHRLILSKMDGKATLEEIARQLISRFPDRYATWEDALGLAGRLSKEYSL